MSTNEKQQTSTGDLPMADRIEEVRKRRRQLDLPRNSTDDTWVLFTHFMRKSPEYIDWLLLAIDEADVDMGRQSQLDAEAASLIDRLEKENERLNAEIVVLRRREGARERFSKRVPTSGGELKKPAGLRPTPPPVPVFGHEDATLCVQDLPEPEELQEIQREITNLQDKLDNWVGSVPTRAAQAPSQGRRPALGRG